MKNTPSLARWLASILVVLALFGHAIPEARAQNTPIRSLIVYDQAQGSSASKLGQAYAIMVRNLLGHWNSRVTIQPVSQYRQGQIQQFDKVFYLGSHFDLEIPPAFLNDVATTTKTVVWFKYNLWQLAWNPDHADFPTRFGFNFDSLRGLNSPPSAANPEPGFFDTVTYKTRPLKKHYAFDAATGAVNADPDIGVTTITDPSIAQTLVSIANPQTGEAVPYVVRGGNFWYFADLPLSFIGPRDRYLVFCDLLHDILGVQLPAQQRALIRLEDVSAITSPDTMTKLSDYLYSRNTPFSIAVIPYFRDPRGHYNNGVPRNIPLASAAGLRSSLRYAQARGGKIVLHGYTHQYGSMLNPHTGVSGDDYEFWDIVNNRVLPEDSISWASSRIITGRLQLTLFGFAPFAWEPPHYQASPNAYKAAARTFRNTYQRAVYYTSDRPNLSATGPDRDFAVGQFFPYIINEDYYGQRILPENLGNIEYDIRNIDPSSFYDYTWEDLKINAENARVVRDGFASFFFHPFWLEESIGKPGFEDFKKVMEAIDSLGFQWVDPSRL